MSHVSLVRRLCLAFVFAVAGSDLVPLGAAETPPEVFLRKVQPILKRLCVGCHGAAKSEADLRVDQLDPDLTQGKDAETWHDVLNKLNRGEMPPKKAPQPSDLQRRQMVDWITSELQRAAETRRSTGGRVVMRRLTRYEYANTLRDLLGIDFDFAAELPPESSSKEGFRNNGAVLGMSPLQIEYYLKIARQALDKAIVSGPRPEVVKHLAKQSAKVRRIKGSVSNRLSPGDRFLARLDRFPRQGEVLVRVRARAEIPATAGYPKMRVTLGIRADVKAPEKTLAEVDVVSSELSTFEFRGRIEAFPLPGHNPKYPGLQVTVHNDYRDANTAKGGKKKKKPRKKRKKGKQPQVEDPTQPVIVIESVEFEGPVFSTWPPRSHARIFFPTTAKGEREYARQILQRFMTRAYRRPVSADETKPMLELWTKVRPRTKSFEDAMRNVLTMVLISPDFLYLVEPYTESQERRKLTNHELASRLSYFLWSTMPDQPLLTAAAGKLKDPSVLERQVKRMLADQRSWQFVSHFTDQWLDLSGIDRVAVNPEFHPGFDDQLKRDMRSETQHFFHEILQRDLSSLNLLDSDFTMVNRRLAAHYGLDGPRGDKLERVALPADGRRGGLLTQGSFLLSNSNGEDSHPIKRAVWVLDRLLNDPPAPPPPDVPELKSQEGDAQRLPLSRQLELHRSKQACNNCHRKIDPWGLAFENYDAVGRWREQTITRRKRKKTITPISSLTTLPDGTKIEGSRELRKYLRARKSEQFAEALVRRLLAYSLGRSLEFSDHQTVQTLTKQFVRNDYRLNSLIVAIVRSDAFQTK